MPSIMLRTNRKHCYQFAQLSVKKFDRPALNMTDGLYSFFERVSPFRTFSIRSFQMGVGNKCNSGNIPSGVSG